MGRVWPHGRVDDLWAGGRGGENGVGGTVAIVRRSAPPNLSSLLSLLLLSYCNYSLGIMHSPCLSEGIEHLAKYSSANQTTVLDRLTNESAVFCVLPNLANVQMQRFSWHIVWWILNFSNVSGCSISSTDKHTEISLFLHPDTALHK